MGRVPSTAPRPVTLPESAASVVGSADGGIDGMRAFALGTVVGRGMGAEAKSGRAVGVTESGVESVCNPGSAPPLNVGADRLAPIGEKVIAGAPTVKPAGTTGAPPIGVLTETEAIGPADTGPAANTANAATEAITLRNASRDFISLRL